MPGILNTIGIARTAAGKAAGGQGTMAGVDRAKVSNVSNQVEVQAESIDAESRSNIFEENAYTYMLVSISGSK